MKTLNQIPRACYASNSVRSQTRPSLRKSACSVKVVETLRDTASALAGNSVIGPIAPHVHKKRITAIIMHLSTCGVASHTATGRAMCYWNCAGLCIDQPNRTERTGKQHADKPTPSDAHPCLLTGPCLAIKSNREQHYQWSPVSRAEILSFRCAQDDDPIRTSRKCPRSLDLCR